MLKKERDAIRKQREEEKAEQEAAEDEERHQAAVRNGEEELYLQVREYKMYILIQRKRLAFFPLGGWDMRDWTLSGSL